MTTTIGLSASWRYASGEAMERFCKSLLERRIEALQCARCARRYLPPRPLCGACHVRLTRWVPVADVGTLEALTVVHVPIRDGRTGRMRPVPYGMGLIKLDGADTTLNHFVEGEGLRIGARVRAVWRDELRGAMDDIEHFVAAGDHYDD